MRWYRYHQRIVGILALFALGIQLVVSFAHVHVEGVRAPFNVSQSRTVPSSGLPARTPDTPGAPQPDHCAVCVTIGLLSNGLSGEPPAISLPALVRFSPLPPVSEARFSVTHFYPFRTRAPPVA